MSLSKFAVSAALLVLANALPQKLDLDAIAAAPTAASGPSTATDNDQHASLDTSFTVRGPTAAATVSKGDLRARQNCGTVSKDVADSSYNGRFGQPNQLTTVLPGVTYWINGGSAHSFLGNIENHGRIVVSQTHHHKQNPYAAGQTLDWIGHNANNGNLQNAARALIQLNDYDSASAPSYDWHIRSMQNDGTIQWCGRGDTGGSTFRMYNDVTSTNNGLISFEQSFDSCGASFVWRNPTLSTSSGSQHLYNNGAFRIINVQYHNVQNIYGNGCWQIGQGGVLYLEDGTGDFQNPTAGPSFPNQSIQFQDSTAVLHLDTAVYSRNSNFGATVYGYGRGNALEFFQTIKSFRYNAGTGVLNIVFPRHNVNIEIGTGYDASKLAKRSNKTKYANYNAIFYDGAVPSQSIPAKCNISAPVCSKLGNGLPGGSSQSTTTSTKPATTTTKAMTTTTSSATTTCKTTTMSSSIVSTTSSSTVSTSSSIAATTAPVTKLATTTTKAVTTNTSSATITFKTTATSSSIVSTTSRSTVSTSSSIATTTAPVTAPRPTTPTTCANKPYTPYYAALSNGYTTDPALAATRTTTAGQACPTIPEKGTYCGFINPLDPCAPQPDGYGPIPFPDNPSAFLAFPTLHALASAAPSTIPSTDNTEYIQVFKDLNAATSAPSYLGLYTLQNYSAPECAAKCDCTELCTAFNIYAERDPSLNPANNDSTYNPGYQTVWGQNCPNPQSMTSYKCTLWGSHIDSSTATNTGYTTEQFQVVVTASDGYDKIDITIPTKVNPNLTTL